jgi:D-sedoheptulose 7-phosphate isomerase
LNTIGIIKRIFLENSALQERLAKTMTLEIEHLSILLIGALEKGKKLLLIGNGGSAADAQHMAGELIGRLCRNRMALPAIALTTDTSVLTCLGNDYGFDQVFARQIEALVQPGDVVLAISTSGESENIIQGILKAKEKGALTLGLLGKGGGKAIKLLDKALVVPSDDTQRVQEAHLVIEHILCELIDSHFSQKSKY